MPARTPPDSAATAGSPARRGARTLKTSRLVNGGSPNVSCLRLSIEAAGSTAYR